MPPNIYVGLTIGMRRSGNTFKIPHYLSTMGNLQIFIYLLPSIFYFSWNCYFRTIQIQPQGAFHLSHNVRRRKQYNDLVSSTPWASFVRDNTKPHLPLNQYSMTLIPASVCQHIVQSCFLHSRNTPVAPCGQNIQILTFVLLSSIVFGVSKSSYQLFLILHNFFQFISIPNATNPW